MNGDVQDLLSRFPEDEHFRLVPLLKVGPTLVERLTGVRPHRSKLHRQATKGHRGIVLRCASDGGTRLTCAAWLVEFLVKLGKR
jgi:hypothetical protein